MSRSRPFFVPGHVLFMDVFIGNNICKRKPAVVRIQGLMSTFLCSVNLLDLHLHLFFTFFSSSY